MKLKIKCQTNFLSCMLVICGTVLSNNLQAMSPVASAARQKVLQDLQTRFTGDEYAAIVKGHHFLQNLTAANGAKLPATVSTLPIVGANSKQPTWGFSLMDLALQNVVFGSDGGSPMLFDLLYFGAPAKSFVNQSYIGQFIPKEIKRSKLPYSLPVSGANVGTLYHAIKANNLASVCAVVATDPRLQIAGADVNSFWLGAACTAASGCCGTNVCNTDIGVCEASGTPVTTCPTVPCQSGYTCVLGSCVKNAPAKCTANSCGVGNYCGAAGSCLPGCLSVTNCGGAAALCDTTSKTCVAQIPGTDSGCSKPADCALGACNSGVCAKPAGCVNPVSGCTSSSPCCPGSVCDLSSNICYTSGAGQIPGTDVGCFSNKDCASGNCTVNSGSTPGSCQKVVACIPGAASGDTPTAANECTPYIVAVNGFNESAAHTSCCAGNTCYAPSEGSGTDACQTCGVSGAGCSGNDGSGTDIDGSCCSGQCNSYSCQ